MINHKTMTFLALALLTQPIQARDRDDDGVDPLKTVGIIGGICLGAYAIGNGIKYLCTPSNESLISNARDAQDYAQRRYDSPMRFLASRNYDRTENTICELQTYLTGSVHSYLRDMRSTLDNIRLASADLSDRLHKLERKGESHSSDYRHMERAYRDLASTESALSRAYEYIGWQSTYSDLYVAIHELHNHYAELLTQVSTYGTNRMTLARYIKEQIAIKGVNNRNPYPLISYTETLSDRINVITPAIQRCCYAPMLLAKANDMVEKLKLVRTILLADDRYAFEIQDRERARREEERLRIERERLEAERLKAEAAQRQAYAAERQNRELAYQNDLLREQNRIERDLADRHRYCNRHTCCCNQAAECPAICVRVTCEY